MRFNGGLLRCAYEFCHPKGHEVRQCDFDRMARGSEPRFECARRAVVIHLAAYWLMALRFCSRMLVLGGDFGTLMCVSVHAKLLDIRRNPMMSSCAFYFRTGSF